jgi:hypothetical protein
MASTIIASAALYSVGGGMLASISKGISNLFQGLVYRYKLSGIVISPQGGKTYTMSHLSSADTIFIDLDPEVWNALDDDEKVASKSINSSLKVNRILFQKAKEVVRDIVEMIEGTSKSIKKVCFLSADYRLLKYLGVPNITYTIGASSYYESIEIPEDRKRDIAAYKDDITRNKGNKLVVYTSLNELMSFITSQYNAVLRV